MKNTTQDYFQKSGIKEIRLLRKHFKIDGSGEKVKINHISSEAIRDFYREYLSTVRPLRLKPDKILPKPDPTILRALYVGDADANVFINNVVRHSLYVDQILIADPMQSPLGISQGKGVLEKPGYWIESTANFAMSLCSMEEWIKEGFISIIPKFGVYFPEVVENYAKYYRPKLISIIDDQVRKNRTVDLVKFIARTNPEDREDMIKSLLAQNSLTEQDDISEIYEMVASYEKNNPIRFTVPLKRLDKYFRKDESPSQIFTFERGIPLTLANEISRATGSYLMFEDKSIYDSYSKLIKVESHNINSFEKISIAFQNLDFPFLSNVTIDEALAIRKNGYLSSFRQYLKNLWLSVAAAESDQELEKLLFNFTDKLKAEYIQLEREWESIYRDFRIDAATRGAAAGLAAVAVGNINLSFGVLTGLGVSVLTGITEYPKFSSELRKVKQSPLAMFLDLK